MKKLADVLFSASMMAVILIIFAFSIATATFIENDFGSAVARTLVYNAHWFEFLLLIGSVNLIGRIIIKKLYVWKKFSILLFHIAFIIILLGSVITRYAGWEGMVSIREGQTTDMIVTNHVNLRIAVKEETRQALINTFGQPQSGSDKTFKYQGKTYLVKVKTIIPNAIKTIRPADHGLPMAELIFADSTGRKSVIADQNHSARVDDFTFSFLDSPVDSLTILLSFAGDSLFYKSSFPVTITGMSSESYTILKGNEWHYFQPGTLYQFRNQIVVLNRFYASAQIDVHQSPMVGDFSQDAMILEISQENTKQDAIIMGKSGFLGIPESVNLNGTIFLISYGSEYKKIPFQLKLNDFIVERYPGSKSPSSFESRVTLIDSSANLFANKRIYMNNILKYKGYRFYQSSYDPDEKGTVLSVNHDYAGTSVTYTGYILMALGMVISMFNRNSRFRQLIAKRGVQRISVLLLILALSTFSGFSQSGNSNNQVKPIKASHAQLFGRMLIQNHDGRVEPVNTLSSEVLRKLLRDNSYKGMNPDQVIVGMLSDPSSWQYEPVIRTTNADIRKLIGSREKYFSFADFFRNNTYLLEKPVNEALRKKPVQRSKFDTEVIKVDEKINICYMVFTAELFRIFPVPGDSTMTWYNHSGIKGRVMSEDSVFTNHVIDLYAQEVRNSLKSGNWDNPGRILNAIAQYQQKYTPGIIPGNQKITAEILLNKTDIFSRISKFYGIIGFFLLVLQFTALFFKRIKLKVPLLISMTLIIILFSAHTTGLITRWYVSGYAPLSNGYEALTYVAWAAVLGGLIFSWRWPVTLSVASILASLILFVAHLSWMDPQITTLVPVLKSYWLVIHVATITGSYAFLGMAALMAFLNLAMMALHTGNNRKSIGETLNEFTDIIEIALTVGLYLLTIGVFLGAVWANESWGRYWGWDPKETWALVTVLVYAFILHMRMIPGMKGVYSFNLASLLGFSSVIMTYFGVNYYLSGLHSYAKGDPLPVPKFIYYTLGIIALTAIAAYFRKDVVKSDTED